MVWAGLGRSRFGFTLQFESCPGLVTILRLLLFSKGLVTSLQVVTDLPRFGYKSPGCHRFTRLSSKAPVIYPGWVPSLQVVLIYSGMVPSLHAVPDFQGLVPSLWVSSELQDLSLVSSDFFWNSGFQPPKYWIRLLLETQPTASWFVSPWFVTPPLDERKHVVDPQL